ncbi:MAG: TfoX/Sxy family protein [Kofleriaceae bacterium]
MAYDENLANRIRRAVGPRTDVTEKKMFGGVAFLLDGKMFCGITNDDLMVRVGPEGYEAALAAPHVRPMDFTGRPMNGYVFVGPAGSKTEKAIKKWVDRSIAFVATVERGAARSRRKNFPGTARRKKPARPKRARALVKKR